MQGEKSSHVQFDDQAALQELERLQRSIQEYRRRREEAEGAFEQFVGSFKNPPVPDDGGAAAPRTAPPPGFHTPAPNVIVPPVPPAAPVEPLAIPVPVAAPPSAPLRPLTPATSVSPPAVTPWEAPVSERALPPVGPVRAPEMRASEPAMVPAEPPEAPAPAVSLPDNFFASVNSPASYEDGRAGKGTSPGSKSRSGTWMLLALVATGSALVVGTLLVRSGTTATPPPAVTVEAPAGKPPFAAAPSAAAPVAPPPPAEVRTARSVWVRVTVDGTRAVERELAADSRVVLPAGRSYVIRSGDAGAVRFILNGQDQGPLGTDAQVVTRTFTARQP